MLRKALSILVVTLAVCGVVATGTARLHAAEVQNKVVAKVNGTAITELEVEQAIDSYVPPGSYHGISAEKREQYRKPALDMLIEREILYQEAKRKGIKAESKEIDGVLEEIKKRFRTKKAFDQALKDSGMTLKDYRSVIGKNEMVRKLLKAEVEDKAKYTDKDIENYYNENKGKFAKPEQMRVSHILMKFPPAASEAQKADLKEKAGDILGKVRSGQDFGELAQKHSEDDYRIKGGDLGWVHKGRLEPALEEALENMKIGESAVVQSQYGYHIVKLVDKQPAKQLSFEESKDSLKKQLEAKKQQELKEALVGSLRAKAKIETY